MHSNGKFQLGQGELSLIKVYLSKTSEALYHHLDENPEDNIFLGLARIEGQNTDRVLKDIFSKFVENISSNAMDKKTLFIFIHDLIQFFPDHAKAFFEVDKKLLDACIRCKTVSSTDLICYPLQTAALWGHFDLVCYLLTIGADPNDQRAASALTLSVHHSHVQITKLLLQFGAKADVKWFGTYPKENIATLIAYGHEPTDTRYNEFTKEYFVIKPYLDKALKTNPQNLTELTKALLKEYVNESIFFTKKDYGICKWIDEQPDCNIEKIKTKLYSLYNEFSNDETFTALFTFISHYLFKCFQKNTGMTKEKLLSIARGDKTVDEPIKKFIADCKLENFSIWWDLKKHSFMTDEIKKGNASLVYLLIKLDPDLPGPHDLAEAIKSNNEITVEVMLYHGINAEIVMKQNRIDLDNAQTNPAIFSRLMIYGNFPVLRVIPNAHVLVKLYNILQSLFKIAYQCVPDSPHKLAHELLAAYIKQDGWYQKRQEQTAHELITLLQTNNFSEFKKIVTEKMKNNEFRQCTKLKAICVMILHDDFSCFVIPKNFEKDLKKALPPENYPRVFEKNKGESSLEFTIRIEHLLRNLAYDEQTLGIIDSLLQGLYSEIVDPTTKKRLIQNFDWKQITKSIFENAIRYDQPGLLKNISGLLKTIPDLLKINNFYQDNLSLKGYDHFLQSILSKYLKLAVECNSIFCAQEILTHYNLVDSGDIHDALSYAISEGKEHFVKLFLENGARIEKIRFRSLKNVAHSSAFTCMLHLLAYGAEFDCHETDNMDIAGWTVTKDLNKYALFLNLLSFKYHYLVISPLLREAQANNPENMADLIKCLLEAYINRSIFYTSKYKQQASQLLQKILGYKGDNAVYLIKAEIAALVDENFGQQKTFSAMYNEKVEQLSGSLDDRENQSFIFNEPFEQHKLDPFYALCEFILRRTEELECFLKPIKNKPQEIKNEKTIEEVPTAKQEASTSWSFFGTQTSTKKPEKINSDDSSQSEELQYESNEFPLVPVKHKPIVISNQNIGSVEKNNNIVISDKANNNANKPAQESTVNLEPKSSPSLIDRLFGPQNLQPSLQNLDSESDEDENNDYKL